MFRGLWAVMRKEVIHIRRDPATRFIFAIPLFQLLLFGYAIDMDVKDISTVVFDLDQQKTSRELIKEFESTRYFRVKGYVHARPEKLSFANG